MKILGIVTSYFPELMTLERNINTYISGVDRLIIWENTMSGQSRINELADKLNNPKVELRTTGENEYLAKPFNICVKEAILEGYTHILTMDQDSFFEENDFSKFISCVKSNNNPNVMMFTSSKSENQAIEADEIEVENAITSGTIYKIDIFEKIGLFREDFMIYMIDIEFSMRVKANGYKIVAYPKIILNHNTGYALKNKIGLRIDNYSAQSTYYIIRNVILNWKIYPEKFRISEKLKFFKYKVIYRTLKIFFEPSPFKKLIAIYMGLLHGLIGKSGKYII